MPGAPGRTIAPIRPDLVEVLDTIHKAGLYDLCARIKHEPTCALLMIGDCAPCDCTAAIVIDGDAPPWSSPEVERLAQLHPGKVVVLLHGAQCLHARVDNRLPCSCQAVPAVEE
jgi:hypothetical protein